MSTQHNKTTLVPEPIARSSAAQFLADYDQVSLDLAVSRDEIRLLNEQLMRATAMAEVLSHDLDQQRDLTQRESARANMWLGYTMKLIGQLETIRATIDTAQAIGKDAAREAAARGLSEKTREDQQLLENVVKDMTPRTIAATAPPPNRITN
jgi:hypothetical protein